MEVVFQLVSIFLVIGIISVFVLFASVLIKLNKALDIWLAQNKDTFDSKSPPPHKNQPG